MEKPFDEIHASLKSQLCGYPVEVEDAPAVASARSRKDYEGFLTLGKALSRQLRYREAIAAYTAALELRPKDLPALRLRAGRYLTTLQWDLAMEDFERCITLGGDPLDCQYRIGLASYYAGQFHAAMEWFESCMPLCDDEMGVAIIYWHALSAYRSGKEPTLLKGYRPGMNVGHHTAYEKAARVFAGESTAESLLAQCDKEPEDLEAVIAMYGVYRYLGGQEESLLQQILKRDGFWPCFSYLAAWNDHQNQKELNFLPAL